MYDRHGPTLVTIAKGIAELKAQFTSEEYPDNVADDVQLFLDAFYTSRVGIRTLIGECSAEYARLSADRGRATPCAKGAARRIRRYNQHAYLACRHGTCCNVGFAATESRFPHDPFTAMMRASCASDRMVMPQTCSFMGQTSLRFLTCHRICIICCLNS